MIRSTSGPAQSWIKFFLFSVASYLAIQTLLILCHEYAHSIAAWLLGYTPTPWTVVWGNPITATGWDEGVPYDQLFPSGGIKPAEAVIGGLPLLMHAAFVVVGLYALPRVALPRRRLLFYAIYWFVVVNLMELVAYIIMRPFAGDGDTGRFNQGLGLSPWYLFLAGTAFILLTFYVFLYRVMPRLNVVVSGSRSRYGTMVWMTAFIMFLWGSGLRVMSLYPDDQWKLGLIGLVAFPGWILADRYRSLREPA